MRGPLMLLLMVALFVIAVSCNREESSSPGSAPGISEQTGSTTGTKPKSSREGGTALAPAAYRGAQLDTAITVDGKVEDVLLEGTLPA